MKNFCEIFSEVAEKIKPELGNCEYKCAMTENFNQFDIYFHDSGKAFVFKFYFGEASYFALIQDSKKSVPMESIFRIKKIPLKKSKYFKRLKKDFYEELANYFIGNLVLCKDYF